MTDNQTTIRLLEKLLALIEADVAHYQERRDNAYTKTVKEYYDKKIWRARLNFERITRRVRALKKLARE